MGACALSLPPIHHAPPWTASLSPGLGPYSTCARILARAYPDSPEVPERDFLSRVPGPRILAEEPVLTDEAPPPLLTAWRQRLRRSRSDQRGMQLGVGRHSAL